MELPRAALRSNHASTKRVATLPLFFTQPSTTFRRPTLYQYHLHPRLHPVASSAASWPGVPNDDECQVESDMQADGRETVTARMLIHASVANVWNVLTDYDHLVEVVPNLIECQELPSPNPNSKRLRQSAGIKCSWWKLQAQAILEIHTSVDSAYRKELHFNLVEGDFKEYRGRFVVETAPNELSTLLIFDAVIEPVESIPRMLFIQAVQVWLPFNLNGIVRAAEKMAEREARISPFAEASMDKEVTVKSIDPELRSERRRPTTAWKDKLQRRRVSPADYLGTAFVPLPTRSPAFKQVPASKQRTLPSFATGLTQPHGVEVHLRKLDNESFLHRRVVCFIRIMASVDIVWEVLTDYERLPEFIPNLVKSEVLPRPSAAPDNYCRIRQIVQQFQTYLQLRAESVMDIVEKPKQEIQFRQVTGFVRRLQGKWILKPSKRDGLLEKEDTLLIYTLDIKTPHSETPLALIEPVFEQAAIEGLPLNLMALKREVLSIIGRPSLKRLCADFDVLREELERCYTERNNVLPTRSQLRLDKRTDLEKAISSHGGSAVVSERMGWKLQVKKRKQRGYWDDFDNLKQELIEFKAEQGLLGKEKTPSKSVFNEAGRVDLRRAIEKWGGIQAVNELMSLDDEAEIDLPAIQKESSKMNIDIRDMDKP